MAETKLRALTLNVPHGTPLMFTGAPVVEAIDWDEANAQNGNGQQNGAPPRRQARKQKRLEGRPVWRVEIQAPPGVFDLGTVVLNVEVAAELAPGPFSWGEMVAATELVVRVYGKSGSSELGMQASAADLRVDSGQRGGRTPVVAAEAS